MKSADSQLLANLGIKKTAENVLKFFFQFTGFLFLLHYTIHKKDFCSTQKYPGYLNLLHGSTFHAGYKSEHLFEIEPTFLVLF